MHEYEVKYLPILRPWTDGCTYITHDGKHYTWDESHVDAQRHKESGRVAELFLVGMDFNQQIVVGAISEHSKKWVQPGMLIKKYNVVGVGLWDGLLACIFLEINTPIPLMDIRCGCCGSL